MRPARRTTNGAWDRGPRPMAGTARAGIASEGARGLEGARQYDRIAAFSHVMSFIVSHVVSGRTDSQPGECYPRFTCPFHSTGGPR
jgi:hypothetical protein